MESERKTLSEEYAMPPKIQPNARRVYWDSSVFIAYINDEKDRASTIEAILEENNQGTTEIFTSQMSIVEVMYVKTEERKLPNAETEAKIEAVLRAARLIDVHELISRHARRIMLEPLTTDADPNGWRVKAKDAVHLATAKFLVDVAGLGEVHCYDGRWDRYSAQIGCKIGRPRAETFAWGVAATPPASSNAPSQPS